MKFVQENLVQIYFVSLSQTIENRESLRKKNNSEWLMCMSSFPLQLEMSISKLQKKKKPFSGRASFCKNFFIQLIIRFPKYFLQTF